MSKLKNWTIPANDVALGTPVPKAKTNTMKRTIRTVLFLVLLGLFACGQAHKTVQTPTTPPTKDDGRFSFAILAMNDVYEINALEGGKVGGMARVATVKKELIYETPYVVTLHAGDFLNPSLLGNIKVNGEKLKGRQMVDVMNAVGIDWVVPGNHEFDLKREELQQRIDESRFRWVVANAWERLPDTLMPFHKNLPDGTKRYFPPYAKWEVEDEDGTVVTIGIVAVTTPFAKTDYNEITDPFDAVDSTLKLMGDCDLVIGLTHLDWKKDVELANRFPAIDLIVGGHDHYHMDKTSRYAHVTKADANARTVYIHRIEIDKNRDTVIIDSKLKALDTTVTPDPFVQTIVDKWEKIGNDAVRATGIDPDRTLTHLARPLDGREIAIRDHPTGLGRMVAKALLAASDRQADCAFINSGSIRIDDYVEGDITGRDVMRILPFGGPASDVHIHGALLKQVLDAGLQNRGRGGYLQWAGIQYDEKQNQWIIGDKPLDLNKTYTCVAPDYVLHGHEYGIEFLNPENAGLEILPRPDGSLLRDIRVAVAHYLQNKK